VYADVRQFVQTAILTTLEIVLGTNPGGITGSVVNEKQEPGAAVFVTLIPDIPTVGIEVRKEGVNRPEFPDAALIHDLFSARPLRMHAIHKGFHDPEVAMTFRHLKELLRFSDG
jgi:hypothetical protein